MHREGTGGFGNFLKFEAKRKGDVPVGKQVEQLVHILKRKPEAAVGELCDDLDISPKRLADLIRFARNAGRNIEQPKGNVVSLNREVPTVDRYAVHRLPMEPIKDKIIFASISDLHFASRVHRQECLEDFMDIAYNDYKVREVMVAGDILAGIGMYPGQYNEIEDARFEGQVGIAVRDIPKKKGLRYHIIGGNHDESFLKKTGADAIRLIGERRADVKSYGWYTALFDLYTKGRDNSIKIEMFHPDKAGAYALSYHIQNAIRDIPGGMKPQILLVGHEHCTLNLPDQRNLAGYLTGCFEDQTLYLKRKHKMPAIGGWIIEVGVTKDGSLKSITSTWIKYYHSRRGPIECKTENGPVRMARSLGNPTVGD